MSLYIPEMNLPTVWPKTITIYPDGTIEDIKRCRNYEKAQQVDAHGRLIDAEEFKKIVANAKHMDAGIFDGKTMYSDHLCIGADYDDVCAAIDETRTIIPASNEMEVSIWKS